MTIQRWWEGASTRRRLLVVSTPVVVIVVLAVAAMVAVTIAGRSAHSAFADRDTDTLRRAAAVLDAVSVIEPGRAHFAAGALAVLDDRLEDADREFTAALTRTDSDRSCDVRINLELVRETLGDRAASVFDGPTALNRYMAARAVAEQAPPGCFAGNTDPDPQRGAVRNDTLPRLDGKIAAVQVAPPPPPPPPLGAAVPPPPPQAVGEAPEETDTRLRLEPGSGNALDKLQQILQDAAGG
ncbi:MAG: hypothetical protein HYZ38_11410 [Mycobacterium sp.]|nr:hypothetical protein [Mycobacterium sp.]